MEVGLHQWLVSFVTLLPIFCMMRSPITLLERQMEPIFVICSVEGGHSEHIAGFCLWWDSDITL